MVLFSHHPLETLVNDTRPPGADRRILADELRDLLLAHPCVIAWVNGHTHIHAVTAVADETAPGGFWQVTTASHIDWPQQARIIELMQTPSGPGVVLHGDRQCGAEPGTPARLTLTTWPRSAAELAANDWQLTGADHGGRRGRRREPRTDRNVAPLPVTWPRRS